ncbi:biotin--[acetyl-CoA-carboxylase] ligase [Neorhizobium sp. NPDC001467]|uniref:biotin--[acetyl-CoA-carboxylase] ligase n=1 Tax=Neorhizobium sp. NPDC001467 TaxID=3390595 RepID=UPI003D05DE67
MTENRRRFPLEAFRHLALDEVGSTNTDALAAARAGDQGLLWITARRQNAGRGRRGRAWTSETGNLYATLLLIDPAPIERTASLPLAVALAVRNAIAAVMPPGTPPVEVKWPNDILLERKKTCGILLEAEMLPDGKRALVIGIGINIRHKPDSAQYAVASLEDYGVMASADELFAHLYKEMAEVLESWNEGRGVADVTAQWRSVACGIGEKITVNLPDRSISGRFAGIDDKGLLMLDTGTELMPIAAGDVFFA